MTPEERADFKIGEHEHINSVFVRCEGCLMFGIPSGNAYDKIDCGNCGYKTNRWYVPSCCVKQAILEERLACAEIADGFLHSSGYMGKLETDISYVNSTAREIAQAIRARGSVNKTEGAL